MRYYVKGQRILANCNTHDESDWIPGIVLDVEFSAHRPYRIELDRLSDGKQIWYFGASYIIDDNRRNRRRKGITK